MEYFLYSFFYQSKLEILGGSINSVNAKGRFEPEPDKGISLCILY